MVLCLLSFKDISAQNNKWSAGTAWTLPKKRAEMGIFQPLRYGLTESVELSTFLLPNIVIPNISLKKGWKNNEYFTIATKHELMYPSTLLKRIAREGTGEILPEDTKVPHIITLKNQFLFTGVISRYFIVTLKPSISLAGIIGKMDMPTIDLPLVYPRTSVYYHFLYESGLSIEGDIISKLDYFVDSYIFLIQNDDTPLAYEHKGLLIWKNSSRFAIYLGYKLFYGVYEFGDLWHFYPLFDLQWGIDF